METRKNSTLLANMQLDAPPNRMWMGVDSSKNIYLLTIYDVVDYFIFLMACVSGVDICLYL